MGEYKHTHTHTCGWQSANGLDLKLTTAADGHCLFVCVVQEADGWSPVWILLVIVAVVVVVVVFVRRWPVVKAYGTKGGHGNSCR